jgi:Ni/Co efflux regulator RcnB
MAPSGNGWKARFDRFWEVWTYRVAKAQAETTFEKLCTAGELPGDEDLVSAIRWQTESGCLRPGKARDGRDTRPHPSTWLNGKRWNDERRSPVNGAERFARPEPDNPGECSRCGDVVVRRTGTLCQPCAARPADAGGAA